MSSDIQEKRKAALFVDFDNMFLGLREGSPRAAEAFASDPAKWIRWMEGGMPGAESVGHDGHRKSILVRRCYLNPINFGKYRAYFTRAGFSVVDCPPLTSAGKNSADIVMVMDILDTLEHQTRFDEFIVMSGDADFTPVFLRLRAYDRRTTALVSTPTAAAYRSACDLLIPEELFVEKALELTEASPLMARPFAADGNDTIVRIGLRLIEIIRTTGQAIAASGLPRVYREFPEFTPDSDWLGYRSLRGMTEAVVRSGAVLQMEGNDQDWSIALRGDAEAPHGDAEVEVPIAERVFARVRALVAASPVPVPLASAAQRLTAEFGPSLVDGGWLASGSFQKLMEKGAGADFEVVSVGPGYLVDPTRHEVPEESNGVDQLAGLSEQLVDLVLRVHRLTDTPDLSPRQYRKLFEVIAGEVDSRGYSIVPTSKAVRDICAREGEAISRSAVNFVLQGITFGGYRFRETQPPHSPDDLAQAFHRNVVGLLEQARVELTDEEKGLLSEWLVGKREEPVTAPPEP